MAWIFPDAPSKGNVRRSTLNSQTQIEMTFQKYLNFPKAGLIHVSTVHGWIFQSLLGNFKSSIDINFCMSEIISVAMIIGVNVSGFDLEINVHGL